MPVRDLILQALSEALDAEQSAPYSVPVVDLPNWLPDEPLTGSAQPETEAPPAATVEPKLDTSRPTWDEAEAHYRAHYDHKGSFKQECVWLDELRPYLTGIYLDQIYDEPLEPFVAAQRQKEIRHHANNAVLRVGVKSKTVNAKLALVRHITREASRKWRRDGKPWLATPPHITMVDGGDERPPRTLTWEQQNEHLSKLPPHLHPMVLFALNTGVREEVVCNLQWSWLQEPPDLGISFFVVPPEHVKGRRGKKSARVCALNSVALRVVNERRGEHETHVFTYARRDGARNPITVMNNSSWQRFRETCGLGDLHVHDLRHTVATRLREAGVREETIAAVLWHTRTSMTAHYAASSIREVHEALELITTPSNVKNATLASLMAT